MRSNKRMFDEFDHTADACICVYAVCMHMCMQLTLMLIKQLTDNPEPESRERGQRLFTMCLEKFKPTAELFEVLAVFLWEQYPSVLPTLLNQQNAALTPSLHGTPVSSIVDSVTSPHSISGVSRQLASQFH